MKSETVQMVVFDLDDTLYPEIQFVKSGFRAVSTFLQNAGIASSDLFQQMWDRFCCGTRRTVFNEVLTDEGIVHDEEFIKRIVDVFRYHKPSLFLWPDAEAVLQYFHDRKKTGLLTDGYLKMQRNKVGALQIEYFFDIIVYSDELGGLQYWKPHAAGYEKIMKYSGFSESQCVYVGDNPMKDFYSAKKLGWKTVRIIRPDGIYSEKSGPDGDYEADVLITDLSQLRSILR